MNSIPATNTNMSSSASISKSTKTVTKKVASSSAAVVAPVVVATPAPVAVAVAAPAVAAPKRAAKRSASTAETAPVATASAPAPVSAAAVPEASTTADAVAESSWNDDLSGLVRHLSTMRDTISSLFTEVKRLEKKVHRTIKDAGKRRKNRKTDGAADESAPKRPTVFNVPQEVTAELNVFFGNAADSKMSRAEVTKRITGYAKEHSLMKGHNINADARLATLLNLAANLPAGEQLTIFNLQRFLRHHYPKSVAAAAAAAASATA